MNYYAFVSLFNGLVALFVGVYIFLKARKNTISVSFAGFAIAIAGWAILYAIWQSQDSHDAALFFMRMTMAPCYFIPFFFHWFAQGMADDNPKSSMGWTRLLIPVLFCLLNTTPLMIRDVTPKLYFQFWPSPGSLMHFCVLIFNAFVLHAFYLLFRAWLKSIGMRRRQLAWVSIPTFLMWAGGSTNWFLWYDIPIPPIPNFSVGIFLLLIAYAIIRRRLFDLDTLSDVVHRARLSALGVMAASLNHELRNPLYIAKGKIEAYLDKVERGLYPSSEEKEKQGRAAFETVLSQLDRSLDIIQRFSVLARRRVASDPQLGTVHLDETLENILPLIYPELEQGRIEIQIDFSKNLPPVRADSRHLEEILLNLVLNACQALKAAGGEVRIHGEQSNSHVRIEISDTGPGISRQDQRRIFEPFYTTREDGTGLGLYIVRQLVERNGGKISVRSKPGEGTAFVLEFQQ